MLPLLHFTAARLNPARLCLMRHGHIDDAGYCVGQTDLPLNAQGQALAVQVASQCDPFQFAWVFASDLQRAKQTAAPIAQALRLKIQTMAALREIDMGQFSGRRWDDLHRDQPAVLARWGEHWCDEGAPGGESFRQLCARAESAIQAIRHIVQTSDQCALIVTHAGVLRALMHLYGGLTPAAAMAEKIGFGDCLMMD